MRSLKLIFEFLPTPEVTLLHTLCTFNGNTQEVSGLQLEKKNSGLQLGYILDHQPRQETCFQDVKIFLDFIYSVLEQ